MVLAATVAHAQATETERDAMRLGPRRKAALRPQASYWTSQRLCFFVRPFSYKTAQVILNGKRSPTAYSSRVA